MKSNSYILEEIAESIGNFCARYGRISVTQVKEKYGSVRVYCGFGCASLHNLLFPRYVYRHKNFPKWLWHLDCTYGLKFWEYASRIVFPYQKSIYKLAYMRAIWQHPDKFDEITSCMDYPEYIGFVVPKLCSNHSVNVRRCYIDSENCEVCRDLGNIKF